MQDTLEVNINLSFLLSLVILKLQQGLTKTERSTNRKGASIIEKTIQQAKSFISSMKKPRPKHGQGQKKEHPTNYKNTFVEAKTNRLG